MERFNSEVAIRPPKSPDHSFSPPRLWFRSMIVALVLAPLLSLTAIAVADSTDDAQLKKAATWQWPDVLAFEEQLVSFLEQRGASAEIREAVQEHWQATAAAVRGADFLARLLDAGALIEPRLQELMLRLNDPSTGAVSPGDFDWLASDVPGWLQDSVRLACGRAMGQRQLYDEALETLAGLELNQVADPSTLLFYRAAAEHHLLQKDACLANIELLLERSDEIERRYVTVAKLMLSDIQPLKEDSLDELSRMMRDVHRRLDLGRAGERVRNEEQQIVDKLDKMIDKLEKQLQQQQAQQSGQQGAQQQSGQQRPMEDSQVAGGSGPGDVDNKDIGSRAGWGNLPPAQRQQALQRLTEELPSHYRSVIEGYFRELAKDAR